MSMKIVKPFVAEDLMGPLEQAAPRIERRFIDEVLVKTLPLTPVDTGRLKASLKALQNTLVSNVRYSTVVMPEIIEEESDRALTQLDRIAAPELRVVAQKTENR
jgi:hypothetical protein